MKSHSEMDSVEKSILNLAYGLTSSMGEKTQVVEGLLSMYTRLQSLEKTVERLLGDDRFREIVEKRLKEEGFVKRGKT